MAPGLESEIIERLRPNSALDSELALEGEDNEGFITIQLDSSSRNIDDDGNKKEGQVLFETSSARVKKQVDEKIKEEDDKTAPENIKPVGRCGPFIKRYRGIGIGLASSFIFSLCGICVKILSQCHNHDPIVICMWTFYGVFIGSSFIVGYMELVQNRRMIRNAFWPFWEKEKAKCIGALFARATTGTISYILFTSSLHYISLSDALVITLSTPVFVSFLARIFLKEHCGVLNVIAAIVTLVGVTVIVKPPFLTGAAAIDTNLLIGVGMALGAMGSLTWVFLCLRVQAVKKLHFSIVTLVYGFVSTCQCAALSLVLGSFELFPSVTADWMFAIPMAFGTFAGHAGVTLACKFEDAGIVALTRTFDVIFAGIWQFLFLSVIPDIFSLIGTLVIISGVLFVLFQKYMRNLPKDNVLRKRLNFIL